MDKELGDQRVYVMFPTPHIQFTVSQPEPSFARLWSASPGCSWTSSALPLAHLGWGRGRPGADAKSSLGLSFLIH